VTNLTRPAESVVAFYNHRGTAEQWIKEGKAAVWWTRLSCRSFAANAVRLQLHALAYNLGTFLRTLAMPEGVERWSLTTLRERLIKISAMVVSHGRYVTSRWPRWRCRGGCSRRCCGSSIGCGRRRRQREVGSGRMGRATDGRGVPQ
jgi:Transposase DDE domain group 1